MSTRSSKKKNLTPQPAQNHSREDLLAVKKSLELLEAGDLKQSKDLCAQILNKLPNLMYANHAMGIIMVNERKFAEAEPYLIKAVKADPNNPDYLTSLGNCELALGRVDESIATFTKALTYDEQHKSARHGLANALLEKDDPEKSIVFFQDLVDRYPGSPAALTNLAKAYIDARRFQEAIPILLKALEHQINFPLAHTHLGQAFQYMGMLDESVECHKTAVLLDPDDVYTHLKAADTFVARKEFDKATDHYARLIDIAPKDPNSYAKLASHYYMNLDNYERASELFEQALSMDPNHILTHNNVGAVKQEYGNFDEAEQHLMRALEMNPDYLTARHNLSLLQLLKGNYAEGWKNHESRLHVKERKEAYLLIHGLFEHIPQWDGISSLQGKSILLMHEQGYGDSIQFIRYIHLLHEQGARVYVHAKNPLVRLFKSVSDKVGIVTDKEPLPKCDWAYVLMSLPLALKTDSVDKIPSYPSYLHAAEEDKQRWKKRINELTKGNPALKVGLIWAGNPEHGNDRKRSIAINKLTKLLRTPDVQFYSLQKSDSLQKDLAQLPADVNLVNLGNEFGDFADTAAAIEAMDLVISVDTSVTHLAGALGKQTWTLLAYVPDWRWLEHREDTPWYPSMRLFRQPKHNDWESVIDRVCNELTALRDKAKAA